MGALEQAEKAVDAVEREPGESVESFARRLYSAHAHVLAGWTAGEDSFPAFCALSRDERATWMDRAALRSILPRE